ncbi:Secondary metabolism regulator [Lachnellula suecica]|uniref:Secondary metabolism regulator n=1 Tax=Lachnellula suecica TaxID=602035 RepID=A0A8T9C9X4_9HELO|nr:Secondary metabolism regulator [Lachnellula suecica]
MSDYGEIEAESIHSFDGDSAYAGSSSGSLTETLSSSIARGIEENGRTYAAYGNEEYGLPIDEEELDRIDMSHAKYLMVLEKRLFLAPIGPQPQRVLDLGTGTGIWAVDMADAYPSAEVLGLDIAPVQPHWVPSNCRFEIDDIEQPWTFGEETFDFIHARDLLLSIRDWPKLVKQCYEYGFFPQVEGYGLCMTVDIQNQADTQSCSASTPNSTAMTTPRHLTQVFSLSAGKPSTPRECTSPYAYPSLPFLTRKRLGAPLDACIEYAAYMRKAGFEDVVEKRVKVPSSAWPKEKRLKLIGAFEMHNLVRGLSAMSLRMFSKAYGWSQEQVELFLVQTRKDVQNLRCKFLLDHICVGFMLTRVRSHLLRFIIQNSVIVYGRKPGTSAMDTQTA